MGADQAATDAEIEAAWTKLEAEWQDESAHKRFIALCVMKDALPSAGQRYRKLRDTDPSRSDMARRQIDAVMAAALANLEFERAPEPQGRRRLLWMGYGLSVFFVLYTLWAVLRAHPR